MLGKIDNGKQFAAHVLLNEEIQIISLNKNYAIVGNMLVKRF